MGIFEDIFSPDHNSIFIHTSKPQYYSGELVQGTVHLNITTPTHIDAISLKVKGLEEARFTVTKHHTTTVDGKSTTQSVQKDCHERRLFFQRVVTIFAAKSTLQPGVFVFPFQFTLDLNMPGSCLVSSGSAKASVYYQVKAEVVVPGFFKANLEHAQALQIIQPLRQALVATQTYKEENVTFLCCIPKGHVSLSANIDRNAYFPNEAVQLKLQVNNSESKVNLEACSLELIQTITLHAQGETFGTTKKVVKTKSPPVASGEVCDRAIQMILPASLEASTNASMVSCTYDLAVRLSVPWSPDVTITQPVQIMAAPMSDYLLSVPSAPNQIMMPQVSITPGMFQAY